MARAYGDQPALARRAAGAARPGRRRAGPVVPRAVDATPRRWTSTARSPRCRTSCGTPTCSADRLPAAAARPAGVRPARHPGAAHLSGDAPAVRLRPARRADRRPRLHQGDQAGPPADLPGGPVPVVDRGRRAVRRRRCATTRDLHLVAVVPRHPDVDGRFALPPNQVGREQAIALCREAAAGPGARLRRGEPRGHPGLRARQGLRGRRRLGQRRQRQLQPPLLDPRQRAVLRGAGRHPRRAHARRPGRARRRRPAASPGTCGWRCWREHLDRDRATTRPDSTRTRRYAAISRDRRRPARLAPRRAQGPRPPGRLLPHETERLPWHQRLWAVPAYRLVYDPDGRPWRDRRAGDW